MLGDCRLLVKTISARDIIKRLRRKCINPYAIYNFGHAGTLARRYSKPIIESAIDKFPDKCKTITPLSLLEGIIKITIVRRPDINPVAEENISKAKIIHREIANLLSQEEN